MSENIQLPDDYQIQNSIHTIREVQVMTDEDLAELYGVETRVLNQAVKRNIKRFPLEFMFQLTQNEYEYLKTKTNISEEKVLISQIVISKENRGGRRKLPVVFTEQGISMLSAVLRSETAIDMSIKIINSFVQMRRFLSINGQVFQRLNELEYSHKITNEKLEKVLSLLDNQSAKPKQGIFFDRQFFDAYVFISKLIKKANKSIVLIDNFIDESVLTLFSKRRKRCKVIIYTEKISEALKLDLIKHNKQYPPIEIKIFTKSHDRFLILDEEEIYHFGASLKDLGRRWFAFSKMDKSAFEMLVRLKEAKDIK